VVMKTSIFWGITPCSPLKVIQHFRGTCRLYLQIKMEATCSSETSPGLQRTTRRYISEDKTLRKISFPCRDSILDFSVVQPVARRHTTSTCLHGSCNIIRIIFNFVEETLHKSVIEQTDEVLAARIGNKTRGMLLNIKVRIALHCTKQRAFVVT
jgi:hypothetical protein